MRMASVFRPKVVITAKIPELGVRRVSEHCEILHHWNKEEALPRYVVLTSSELFLRSIQTFLGKMVL